MDVPNKRKINTLAFRMIKTMKSRSFFSVVAVMLTGILIMMVLTMGVGMINAGRLTQMKSSGQKAEISFQYLLDDELQSIISNRLVKEYGISRFVGAVNEVPWNENTLEIRTADEKFADMMYSTPKIGRLPKNENEVAVKSWMLEKLGIEKKTGEEFPLSFAIGNTRHDLKLTVCGIWDDDYYLLPYGTAYISDSLADKLLTGIDVKQNMTTGLYNGTIQLCANLNGDLADLDKNLDSLVSEAGVDENTSFPRVNSAYSNSIFDIKSLCAIASILLIVIISGYLLIYNIFYISVIKDIKFYGLLNTIGTTSKQIKRIVNVQALVYCLVGIPLGLVIGYILAVVMFPLFISATSIDKDFGIKPNMYVMITAALLSLITVFISCTHPAKIAAKISPVDSARYTGITSKITNTTKNGFNGAGIHRMACSNLFKNRKKTNITIASVSIGLILMNIFFTFTTGFNVDEMVNSYIFGDFLIADESYLDMADSYTPAYTLSDKTIDELKSLNGVDDVAKVYYKYDEETYLENGTHTHSQIYGMDDYWMGILEKNMTEGEFEKDKFLSGKYILIGCDRENVLHIGDKVTLNLDTGKQYEVMGKVNYSNLYAVSARFYLGVGFSAYLPESELVNCPKTDIMSATVMAQQNKLDKLNEEIDEVIDKYTSLDFRSREDYLEQMNNKNSQFTFVGMSLSLIILLIGVLNFINTSLADIFSRKYEFAVLQAIGMTTGQMRTMLITEGLYFIAITGVIFISIGTAASYLILNLFMTESMVYVYHFSILPIAISLSLLFLTAVIIPQIFYKAIAKKSVVERLYELN